MFEVFIGVYGCVFKSFKARVWRVEPLSPLRACVALKLNGARVQYVCMCMCVCMCMYVCMYEVFV